MAGTDLVRKNLYALSVDNTSLFQDIREKAWDRMLRRLESSSVIDDTHLIRLFVEVTKIQASLEAKVHEGKDEKEIEIMQLVTDAGLPLEARHRLLDELEGRGVDVDRFRKAMLEKGEQNGG